MAAYALSLTATLSLEVLAQTPTTPTPAPQSSAPCAPPPSCPAPTTQVIAVEVTLKKSGADLPITNRSLYLSPCPFNLDRLRAQPSAPSRKSYYASVKASEKLIDWLEANNCDTIYCRELTKEEVTCKIGKDACVREFVEAYNEALSKLKNDDKLALKWVTNYGQLSTPQLRTGFYEKKEGWLKSAVEAIEKGSDLPPGTIKTAVTDREGKAYFYNLCPGTYYISNIAPAEAGGERIVWETTAIKVEKAPRLKKTTVKLTDTPGSGENYFVGKNLAEAVSSVPGVDRK